MLAKGLSAVEIINLSLAILGVVTGVSSFIFSALVFKWSGPQVGVEATHGVTFPPGNWNITVRVTNGGRQAVTVRDIEIQPVGGEKAGIAWPDWKGVPLPLRLEAGADECWRIEEPEILRDLLMRTVGGSDKCRAVAVLGNGRRILSNAITVDKKKGLEGFSLEVIALPEQNGEQEVSKANPDAPAPEQGHRARSVPDARVNEGSRERFDGGKRNGE
ncbi:hypothetical protein ABZS52_30830 [Micromonospora profundi]|uniref:hypothetical protein n=1 Tax=Micromonospora profundi TaxID=1420889 RepID=UPI0033A43FDE